MPEAKFPGNSEPPASKSTGNSNPSELKLTANSSTAPARNSGKLSLKSAPAGDNPDVPATAPKPKFKEESDKRKERMRREPLDWAARYQHDKKYSATVQQRENEPMSDCN